MSVRLSERLIGEVVIARGLPYSPLMIVQGYEEESKMVSTTWFSDQHECQEGLFPAKALDKAEPHQAKKPKGSSNNTKAKK
jgi:hypothetical protein